jgi:hypothetical protein
MLVFIFWSATASAFARRLLRALRNRFADFVQFLFCFETFLKRFRLIFRFFNAFDKLETSSIGSEPRELRLLTGDCGSGGGAELNELGRFIL